MPVAFSQDPASVRALHDARHTPLENDLAAWVNAMEAASGYRDAAMRRTSTTGSRVRAGCSKGGVQALPALRPAGAPAVPGTIPAGCRR
jgi:hypothetical protein